MREYMEKLCLILLFVLACGNTEATFENGGYSVLVSFSPNVPPKDGRMLLYDMKESLTDASKILQEATGLGFSKVVFKIPMSWDTSELNASVEESLGFSSSKSDFLIHHTNDVVFGKQPFAQQYGGCGLPGRQITVPTVFFDEANTFPKGISLAREWMKYFYGVFDENGYFADPLYPLYYTIPGSDPNEVKITDCTNEQVTYNFLDQKGNDCVTSDATLTERLNSKECVIEPDGNTENITSSMMYFQEDIHTLRHICGRDSEHKHNSRAPNKQNALCYGQSIWDVVKKSRDFQEGIKQVENKEGYIDTEFVYIQESKPKVVIAWENTNHTKSMDRVILNAIKQFLIDLPSGSKFNGFPFNTGVPRSRTYSLLEDKNAIIGGIASDFVNHETDVNVAISKALEIFSSSSEEEGTIIIITKSIQTANEITLQMLKESRLCIMFILLSEEGIPANVMAEIERYRSVSNCTTVKEILTTAVDEDSFRELLEDMETFLPSSEDKATETAKFANLSQGSPINLHVSESIETVTFTVFSNREADNFNLEFNEIKQDTLDEETIGDVLVLSFSPTQAGDIKLDYPYEAQPMLTHVRLTTKEGKYFTGEILISDTSEEESVQMPIIIYAIVRYGAYPVQNAKVLARVERPNEKEITFELNDDGKGNPDITQNDGVYSRYFTGFSEKGLYTVTVTVQNNGDLTTFGVDKNTGYQSCCGSYVNGDTSHLTEFTKILKTTFEAKSGRPDDGYKPLRISDLRIDKVAGDKITLKWTAPGEEADHGAAQSYEIKYFTSQDEAMNNFNNGKLLNYTSSPQENGEEEHFTIDFSDFEESGLYYIAIKTKNSNKISDVSNIIEMFIPEVTTTEGPDGGNDETGKDVKKGSVNNKTVGIIIGVIVGLIILVIIIYMIVYYLVVKPKREKESKQNEEMHAPKRNENNAMNPINFVSATTLIEHHNEKRKAKLENKEPPILKEEDFEDKNSLPTTESTESASNNNHTQQLDSKNTIPINNGPTPPKSPKRTTFV